MSLVSVENLENTYICLLSWQPRLIELSINDWQRIDMEITSFWCSYAKTTSDNKDVYISLVTK